MSIKLMENTGYKYDPVYRFCGWEHTEDIRPVKPRGAETIGQFYLACRVVGGQSEYRPVYYHRGARA